MSRPKQTTDTRAIRSNGAAMVTVPLNGGRKYRAGIVRTPHGLAWIPYVSDEDGTLACFIHRGTEHQARWKRTFTDRGLAITVGRWVWDVVNLPTSKAGR